MTAMNNARIKRNGDDKAVDDAFACLETMSVRQTEKAIGRGRDWLNKLKKRFPQLHAAMRERKTLRIDSMNQSSVVKLGTSKKAGNAFLRRALKYSPDRAPRIESVPYAVIYGQYLVEHRLRVKGDHYRSDLESVFCLNKRTAQRLRRLALAFTKRHGLDRLCKDAVQANKPFPQHLFARISNAVGSKTLRQLYLEHHVR